jgi:glutamate N-acetyltransferase/amino-acid N-acetyltransferase
MMLTTRGRHFHNNLRRAAKIFGFTPRRRGHSSRHMPSTQMTFTDRASHRAWLATQAALPAGFRVGSARFDFTPAEAPKPAKMTLTLIALDRPSPDFAAVFTKNAFPGAPVVVGRTRLAEPALAAIIINNKISNVCAPGGVEASERICAEAARLLGVRPDEVLPSSTGVIGWGLPVEADAGLPPRRRRRPGRAGSSCRPPRAS